MAAEDREICSQCGVEHYVFREGVCIICWQNNQDALDLHNVEYDGWQKMTDAERAAAIRAACN